MEELFSKYWLLEQEVQYDPFRQPWQLGDRVEHSEQRLPGVSP